MSDTLTRRLEWLHHNPALLGALSALQRGLEKESLRVDDNGHLALTDHPPALGSALTHPKITTDYSEALLEFITPVSTSISDCLQCLTDIHQFTAHQLASQQEMLWTASMPCRLGPANDIPVARYGPSNVGTMKTIYRIGLGHRYGRAMQTISGIHYNFSLSDKFWARYQPLLGDNQPLSQFKTEQYFGLMRNFRRLAPLLVYLTGSSPALCKSFLQGHDGHHLDTLDDKTLYREYATSLRMSDLGYQSNAQKALFVCYNSLDNYIRTLRHGITETYPPYQAIGLKDGQGHYRQLNTALLQIENEFYSTIRPKRVTASGEAPINALRRGGVEYIEVRCLDVNPFTACGIDAETLRFVDVFLLYCLLEPSPPLAGDECHQVDANLARVVNDGRKPGLVIVDNGQPVDFHQWANDHLAAMQPLAALLDRLKANSCYQKSLALQQDKFNNPALTPSAQLLARLRDQSLSFAEFTRRQSRHWQSHFLDQPLSDSTAQLYRELAADSIAQQQAIEAADTLSFDDYLARFYQQYRETP
ncbi:MAG TPA: glutamate--cysteine ligase [Pseudomonadales bacterium]